MAHNRIEGFIGGDGGGELIGQEKFSGVWIPACVLRRLWNDEITPREMVLLATIDSLVGIHGCFASNGYLAERCRVTEIQISRMLRHLKKLKLVRQISFNGRQRRLDTKWHRAEKPFSGDSDG